MNIRKILFSSLLIGSLLALVLRLFSRLFASLAPAKSVSRGTSYHEIDAYVKGQMRRLHIPGASLAIVEGDQITHRRGFGVARPGGEVPAPTTPFFIGSLTKSITALAIMQLVEAGKVELDAPVQRYLPWFRVADPQASAQMTVRHLLNQVSGMSMFSGSMVLADLDDRPDATERQVRSLSSLQLIHPVGSKWNYCNHNFNVLGLIIEAASGETYSTYIQKHIFDPLGMCHSYTTKAAAKKDGLAMGYRHWFSLPLPAPDVRVPGGSLPARQLISCAEDITHYLIAHLNGGRYGQAQILSGAGIDELHRGVVEFTGLGIAAGRYGMGWFDQDIGGTKTYYHGGNVPEYCAFMALIPEQKKGVVLLFNADPWGLPMVVEEVGMNLTALLAGEQPEPMRFGFIPWVMRLLPLIPLLQLAGVLTTLLRIRRWRWDPEHRPSPGRIWGQHILLPLIPDLALASALVYLRSSGLIRFMDLFMPDLAWTARVSGGLAATWAFLRTGLILRAIGRPSSRQ